MSPKMRFAASCAALFFLSSCALAPQGGQVVVKKPSLAQPREFLFQRQGMNTLWNFTLVADTQEHASAAFNQAAPEIDRLDMALAMWRPQSELSKVNNAAGGDPVPVSHDLLVCLKIALKVAADSKGAFDPTVGPLTQAWWDALQANRALTKKEARDLRKHVDYRKVQVDESGTTPTVRLAQKGMRLDLGGVAKGYAQDVLAAILRQDGIRNFLINAGGQVYAAGVKADGTAWKVGIEDPRNSNAILTLVNASDLCMATSGDYEQFKIIGGKRYSHIFDPKTGMPAGAGSISSTSLVPFSSRDYPGAFSDAIGTAAFVKGPGRGKDLLQDESLDGILVGLDSEGREQVVLTAGVEGKLHFNLRY